MAEGVGYIHIKFWLYWHTGLTLLTRCSFMAIHQSTELAHRCLTLMIQLDMSVLVRTDALSVTCYLISFGLARRSKTAYGTYCFFSDHSSKYWAGLSLFNLSDSVIFWPSTRPKNTIPRWYTGRKWHIPTASNRNRSRGRIKAYDMGQGEGPIVPLQSCTGRE